MCPSPICNFLVLVSLIFPVFLPTHCDDLRTLNKTGDHSPKKKKKNAVLSVTQIRAFPLHEPLVSRLQVIVRVSCHRIEGWFLYCNEHAVSQVVVHLRLWNLQVLSNCDFKESIMSSAQSCESFSTICWMCCSCSGDSELSQPGFLYNLL